MSLVSLGIEAALVKQVAEYHSRGEQDRLNRVFSAAALAFGGIGIIGAIALALFTHFLFGRIFHIPAALLPVAESVMFLLAVQTVFEFPAMAFTGVIQGLQRYDIAAAFDVVRSATFALLAVVALRSNASLTTLAAISTGLALANVICLVLVVRRLLPALRLTRNVRGPDILAMAHLSGQIFILRINNIVYWQMDKAILAVFLATSALTHYDVAARFHSLITMVMGLLASVLLSSSAALHAERNKKKLRELFLLGTKYSAGIAVPGTIGIMILAQPLLQVWVGPEFAGDANLVRLFLGYTLYWVLVQVGWNLMIGMDQTLKIVRIQLSTTLVNLILSATLAPKFGIAGVLIGTMIGNTVAFLLYVPLFLRVIGVSLRTFLTDVIVRAYAPALVGAAALLVAMRIHTPIGLLAVAGYGIGSVAISSAVFWLAGLDARERERFISLTRRAAVDPQIPLAAEVVNPAGLP
jgi:O-antigen/teichoic acid export membrane protein